jgi:hypothetical protein
MKDEEWPETAKDLGLNDESRYEAGEARPNVQIINIRSVVLPAIFVIRY